MLMYCFFSGIKFVFKKGVEEEEDWGLCFLWWNGVKFFGIFGKGGSLLMLFLVVLSN